MEPRAPMPRLYTLSFESPQSTRDFPKLVFGLSKHRAALLQERKFVCDRRVEKEGVVRYAFLLRPVSHFTELRDTLYAFSHRLDVLESVLRAESEQEGYQLFTVTATGPLLYGWIFPVFRRWLAEYAKRRLKETQAHYLSLPESITNAMRVTWKMVALPGQRQYVDDCRSVLSADGRFFLSCFGDACDIGIYPDGDAGIEARERSQLGFHNLDTPAQQLTLLAGLAAFHDFADKEINCS